MRTVPIHDLKRRLSELVDEVEGGARIVITRHGAPVAALVPAVAAAVHVGQRFGRAKLHSLRIASQRSISHVLDDDRAADR